MKRHFGVVIQAGFADFNCAEGLTHWLKVQYATERPNRTG